MAPASFWCLARWMFTLAPTLPPAAVQETKPIIPINRNFAVGLAALYLLFLCYRGIMLFRAWLKVRAIVRSACPIELSEPLRAIIGRCQTALGVTEVRRHLVAQALEVILGERLVDLAPPDAVL